ncbi:MAG: PEP-CTERM sorting domain-containing protein, partial [Deltaproteobacteria bacterium CG23_combo_of_CG06-09_8_20_14_all_60_8]
TPGDTYHLTLAIADAGDWSLDSGVFIGAGTLSEIPDPDIPGGGGNAPVPEPATMLLFATGLIGFAGYSRKKMQR